MFKSKMLIVATLVLFCIIGASARSCVSVVPQTGQTVSDEAGDDGDLQRGMPWPNPRFTDNGDGTVTDNLTQLIWLKDANCFGARNWTTALSDCITLEDGECELSDSSIEGDWRLPNVKELHSLIDFGYDNPALSNAAGTGQWSEGDSFTGVQSDVYWSSSTYASIASAAWCVYFYHGGVRRNGKSLVNYVWCVRGGA